jgi:hypothetical protein
MTKQGRTEKQEHRRAWLSAHPARGALIGALYITISLLLTVRPVHAPLRGLAVAAIFSGLIGLGLYFVFRDPSFQNPPDVPEREFGRKLWHKLALAFLVALGGLTIIFAIASQEWGGIVVGGVILLPVIGLTFDRVRARN